MFPSKKSYKSEHVILDRESFEHDPKDFSFTFIELPKFIKAVDELSSIQEKWCYFFKHAEETSLEDLKKIIGNDEVIERAYSELDRFGWSEEELLTYDQSEKHRKDYLSALAQKFDEGEAKGRAEERIIMTRELKRQGVAFSVTEHVTSLSRREIEERSCCINS